MPRRKVYNNKRGRSRKSRSRHPVVRSTKAPTGAWFQATPNRRTGGMLDNEIKYFDSTVSLTNFSASWAGGELDPAANCLNGIDQGTGATQRDGRRIRISKISVQGRVSATGGDDQASAPSVINAKLCLVLDTQTNATQLSAEDVYDESIIAATDKLYAFRNLEHSRRFQVLWSHVFDIVPIVAFTDGTNTGTYDYSAETFNLHIPCDIIVEYVSHGSSNVDDIGDNSLHMIGCATNAGASVEYVARIRFTG